MSKNITCAQGHHWDPAIDAFRMDSQRGLCPVCGDLPMVVAIGKGQQAQHSQRAQPPKGPKGKRAAAKPATVLPEVMPVTPAAVAVQSVALSAEAAPPWAGQPGMQWSGVDLGPALPMAVFTSTETWQQERVKALALYCSDGRWGDAFDEFCHKRLLIPRYDRWAVPGGPAWLIPRDHNKEFFQAVHHQLEFLVRAHALERMVLIAHHGCAYYGDLLRKESDDCLPTQMDDLRTGRANLQEWFPTLAVDCYLAMRRGPRLSFHQVTGERGE